jgi:hypothetical protein
MAPPLIVIDAAAAAADSIMSVKQRVFAINREMPVHGQRLMYRPGPPGIEPLADDQTLGGACVAQDGIAVIGVLLTEEIPVLGPEV